MDLLSSYFICCVQKPLLRFFFLSFKKVINIIAISQTAVQEDGTFVFLFII